MGRSFFSALILYVYALLSPLFLNAQDLGLTRGDLRIEMRADGGYHLFVRCKPDIASVLLTESTRDPTFSAENYAYRAAERNAINGDEIRLINGVPITPESRIYSLVSSTPKWHPSLGWSFHIYIPNTLLYGYEGGRHGEVQVGDGTYLNIRTFYYAYADYRGSFMDNPFVLRVSQETQRTAPAGTYLQETVDAFYAIAGDNTVHSTGPEDMINIIYRILDKEKGNDVDIVVVLDVTGSMKPYFDAIRMTLIPHLQEIVADYDSFRIGMVFYKDYYDEFLNRVFPFTTDFNRLQREVNTIRVGGGGDIPEAVHEALFAGATRLSWAADKRIMILIGDAPPHLRPRGRITKQMVDRETARRGIEVHAIILPQ
jgi:Mg-chelatase subunit ChlD